MEHRKEQRKKEAEVKVLMNKRHPKRYELYEKTDVAEKYRETFPCFHARKAPWYTKLNIYMEDILPKVLKHRYEFDSKKNYYEEHRVRESGLSCVGRSGG